MSRLHMARIFGLVAVLGLSAPALIACEDQGPAEEAGEAIDEGVEEMGDAVDDATD